MTINKEFIPCNCTNKNCSYFTFCDMLPTEVIRHQNREGIDILIFGQGAGKEESKLKRCFVGRSGKYMRSIIKHLWDTYGVFNLAISNNVRFHPMDENGKDREPTPAEISRCLPHLLQDIVFLNPKVIMPVGKNAASTFLTIGNSSMTAVRGHIYSPAIFGSLRKVIPTWHPSFLVRQYGKFVPYTNNQHDNEFINDILLAIATGV